MRKLLWFTVGYSAAVAACAYFLGGVAALLLAASLGALTVFLCKKRTIAVPMVICLGLAAGMLSFWCYDTVVLSKARLYDGITTELTVTASDYTFHNGTAYVTDGTAVLQGRRFAIRLFS